MLHWRSTFQQSVKKVGHEKQFCWQSKKCNQSFGHHSPCRRPEETGPPSHPFLELVSPSISRANLRPALFFRDC